jgi:hypothetical protein
MRQRLSHLSVCYDFEIKYAGRVERVRKVTDAFRMLIAGQHFERHCEMY